MSAEKFTINSDELVHKVKQLIHEGNIRRVRVIHEGRTVLEIPLSVGAGAAALVTECTIEVEKIDHPVK